MRVYTRGLHTASSCPAVTSSVTTRPLSVPTQSPHTAVGVVLQKYQFHTSYTCQLHSRSYNTVNQTLQVIHFTDKSVTCYCAKVHLFIVTAPAQA